MSDIADGLRDPLFECYLYGDLLDLVNKQRAEAASEIERLRAALRRIACDNDTCDCNYYAGSDGPFCELGIARAALGEEK